MEPRDMALIVCVNVVTCDTQTYTHTHARARGMGGWGERDDDAGLLKQSSFLCFVHKRT